MGDLKEKGQAALEWLIDASNELLDDEKLNEAERMERELEISGIWRALYVAEISGILEHGDTVLTQYGPNYQVELISGTVAPIMIRTDIQVDMIIETGEVGPELALFDITKYKRLVKLPDGRWATVRVVYIGPAE